jgi:hypothetical protein
MTASVQQLSERLRAEIGDIARSFTDTFTGDGITSRFQLSQAPVQGYTLVVTVTTPAATATVTAASANGTTVTYTSANTFAVGQVVSIAGLSTNAFNLTNATIATRSATQFTVTSTVTGTAVTGAAVMAVRAATTVDRSVNTTIEEGVGVLSFAINYIPADNEVIKVYGQAYRYFTDSEISYYINTAFFEHAKTTTDTHGARVPQVSLLPTIDEYPLVLLASTMALYTLATDSAFDIDIISPDGVSIPRSERFRQLMQIVEARKAQYKELCVLLGVGMYRIEVATLRRISRLTNRYVPVYRPKEIDDHSLPDRVNLPMPDYGDITPPTPVLSRDISMYAGDDFSMSYQFGFDLTNFTPKGQVRLYTQGSYAQIGPLLLADFTITKFSVNNNSVLDGLVVTLPSATTTNLPKTSYYDIQMTGPDGKIKTYATGKVFTEKQVTI